MTVLPRLFYSRDTVQVAKELLGKKLIRRNGKKKISGIITETEAYRYKDDPASHAYRGLTKRNKIMFSQVGMAYVYFTYGMHYCVNVVARNKKCEAGAVLIRALKPTEGINTMIENRKTDMNYNLTNGPGKLTQALNITIEQCGEDLVKKSSLYITEGIKAGKINVGPRVGIKSGIEKLWNFKIII